MRQHAIVPMNESDLERSARYRLRGEEVRTLADGATDVRVRQGLLDLAAEWDALATQAERFAKLGRNVKRRQAS